MHHISLVTVALAVLSACKKDTSSGSVDLTTPEAAARCQVTAVRARNTALWVSCFHPLARTDFDREIREDLERNPDRWDRHARDLAALEGVENSDFTMEPVPAGKEELGDLAASFRLEDDSFHAVRKGGRWYIVDTGI